MPIASRRTSKSVVAKLVVAASTYYIWQERNWRLFNKGKRSLDQVCDCIKSSVRLKLLSCRFKKSKSGDKVARLWDLPEAGLFKLKCKELEVNVAYGHIPLMHQPRFNFVLDFATIDQETCLILKKNIIEAKVKDQVVEDLDAKKKETLQEVIREGAGEGIAFMSTIYIDDDEIPKLMAGETFEAAAKEGQKS
ncbi:hypothetical protein Tco_1267280 [Tanacetum coccineum]